VLVLLTGVALALFALWAVAYPFLAGRGRPQPEDLLAKVADLQARRMAVYEEARALRLERDLGQVSEEEFRRRWEALRLRAADLLREEERLRAHRKPPNTP